MDNGYVVRVDGEMYELLKRYAKTHNITIVAASRELAKLIKQVVRSKSKQDIHEILNKLL